MNLTFFPMHFAGLLGMPRRIYTYEAGQGWEAFNMMSSVGTAVLMVGTLIFVYNFFRSFKTGAIAGNDPWGGGTLEWSIPSPPPEYNFARIPRVTSRYPMWDVKSPALTAEVPHTVNGDKRLDVDVGQARGHAPSEPGRQRSEAGRRIRGAHRARHGQDGEGPRHPDAEPDDQAAHLRRRHDHHVHRPALHSQRTRCRSPSPR